jgi:thiol peroxidase
MEERENVIAMHGNPLTLLGPAIEVGQDAPDFKVVGNDLSEVSLSDFKDKVVVISAVPSLDTPVCDVQTRRFNEEAANLGGDVVILTVSMDLPFAQGRWCGAAGVKQVATVSDYQQADFGSKYGLLIKGLRLLTRAVLVVDKGGKVQYVEVVGEITNEPDYDAALATVKELV